MARRRRTAGGARTECSWRLSSGMMASSAPAAAAAAAALDIAGKHAEAMHSGAKQHVDTQMRAR